MWRYLFKRDTLFATAIVFLVIGLFIRVEKTLGILDPKDIASKDFDYNDLDFYLLNGYNNATVDTGIIIINIGNADRKGIAHIIECVDRESPKVTGLDILLDHPGDEESDSLLRSAVSGNKEMVLATQFDAVKTLHGNYFATPATQTGYANFSLEPQNIIREFNPYVLSKDSNLSFSAAIVKATNPGDYRYLLGRNNKTEAINYTLPENRFIIIDGNDPQADFGIVRNKVVLIGFIGSAADYTDKHFTPLNEKLAGKSMPDMSGVLIHANTVRMMLGRNYIHKSSSWLNWLIAIVLCWLLMAFFIGFSIKKPTGFDLLSKLIQLILAICLVYFGLVLFYKFNLQIDLTLAVVIIALSEDVLGFYRAAVLWLNRKNGFKTIFKE